MSWKRGLIAALMLCLVAFASSAIWLPRLSHWLEVSHPESLPVRYVVALPGRIDTRVFAAAALVRSGQADQAVVIRNVLTPDVANGETRPSHEITRDVYLRYGLDDEKIVVLSGESRSTFTDLEILGQLLRSDPTATVAIVTDPFHTRRAAWTARRVLPDHQNQICVIACYNDLYDDNHWWQSDLGLRTVSSEYLKLIFYRVQYSTSRQRLVVLIGFVAVIGLAALGIHRRRKKANEAIA